MLPHQFDLLGDFFVARKRECTGSEKEGRFCSRPTALPHCAGRSHADTLASVMNMGSVLLALGRPGAAEPLFRAALKLKQAHLGPTHASTLDSAAWAATLLQARGELAEAEPLLCSTLAVQRQTLGARAALPRASACNGRTSFPLCACTATLCCHSPWPNAHPYQVIV